MVLSDNNTTLFIYFGKNIAFLMRLHSPKFNATTLWKCHTCDMSVEGEHGGVGHSGQGN